MSGHNPQTTGTFGFLHRQLGVWFHQTFAAAGFTGWQADSRHLAHGRGAGRVFLRRVRSMRLEIVVDKEALDHGQFRNQGGFNRMNRLFDGRLEDVLGELHEEVWRESA